MFGYHKIFHYCGVFHYDVLLYSFLFSGNLHQNHHHLTQAMILGGQAPSVAPPMVPPPQASPMPPSPLTQRRMQQQLHLAEAASRQQQRHFNNIFHNTDEEEPLIPPRSTSKPQVVRTVRPQTPPNHPRVLEASNELGHQRSLHTPPRALLNMDITQRNMHELQNRASMSPPPPAPPPPPQISENPQLPHPQMHPPIAALVSQRREALVRTNPRLRHVSTVFLEMYRSAHIHEANVL